MRTAMVAWLALALTAAATALCAASPRVNIPIVARPRDEPEFRGPFPIRDPEWVGRGESVTPASIRCLATHIRRQGRSPRGCGLRTASRERRRRSARMSAGFAASNALYCSEPDDIVCDTRYLLDVCQLRNVTATKQIPAPVANAEGSAVSDGSGEAATPAPEPEVPRLLGYEII